MNVDCLDEIAVMTYVACLCDAVHRHSPATDAANTDADSTAHQKVICHYEEVGKTSQAER